jgi:hypothetical protein
MYTYMNVRQAFHNDTDLTQRTHLEADAGDVAVESLALLARNLELELRGLARAISSGKGTSL